MKNSQLKNIVAFCALMENGDGIASKAPSYIIEKFERYCLSEEDRTSWGLDSARGRLVKDWEDKWIKRV